MLIGMVVLGAIGFLAYMTSKGASILEVSDLKAMSAEASTRQVKVLGKVLVSSIERDETNGIMRFLLTDGKETVPVLWRGGVTSQFYRSDADVMVEGRLRSDGVFVADNLVSRHASRFEADKQGSN
jgi:cytochrome c-type biogenesis protein CcmE